MTSLTQLKHIEKLIMGVDKDDTDTLDEIDARVACIKHGKKYVSHDSTRRLGNGDMYIWVSSKKGDGALYTPKISRSIDAQAAIIIPDEWVFSLDATWPQDGIIATFTKGYEKIIGNRTTEPLARLLAIVRIWIWEIENDDS